MLLHSNMCLKFVHSSLFGGWSLLLLLQLASVL
jgi:hypothetical protein